MGIRTDHHARRYRTPAFAPPPDPLELAAKFLLGQARVTLGEPSFLPSGESGDRISDLARRFEDLRFELVTRQFKGETLSPEERGILAAINAALLETMPQPTPESEQVRAAVEEAKILIARRRAGG